MKSAAFAYQHPVSLHDAVSAAGRLDGSVKFLGGGQSLGPMLNLRLVRAQVLVDVSDLPESRTVERRSEGIWIGGATTHAEIEDGKLDDIVGQAHPLATMLRYVAGTIAYRAVRNRGTVAGSIAHADPAADWVLAMTALNARLHCVSNAGRRDIAMSAFMSGAFTTALQSGELISGVVIPAYSDSMRWGYYKFCRKTGEFAEASCATVFDPENAIARIVVGAMDGAPVSLDELAVSVARVGVEALTDRSVRQQVDRIAGGKDEAEKRLICAAIKRSVKQALGVS